MVLQEDRKEISAPEDVADLQLPEMKAIAEGRLHGVHPALIALKWAHREERSHSILCSVTIPSNLKCVTEDPLTEEEMKVISTLEKATVL